MRVRRGIQVSGIHPGLFSPNLEAEPWLPSDGELAEQGLRHWDEKTD